MQHAVLDEVITLNKAAMHGALDALEKAVGGAERIARHQLDSAWSMIRDTIDDTSVPANSKEDALDAWRNERLQPLVLRFLDDSRRHFELSVRVQQQVTDVVEEQCAEFALRSAQTIERLSRDHDVEMAPILDAVRRTVEISAGTLDEMRRMTRQLALLAAVGAEAAGVQPR